MIWRLADRNDFHRLQQHGRRARHGVLWMTWLSDAQATPPRVGYAVGRPVGRAVTRNLVRRRFRAIMRDLSSSGHLPGGLYLLGARPGVEELTYPQLTAGVHQLVGAIDPSTS